MRLRILPFAWAACFTIAFSAAAVAVEPALRDHDRIVFVGDSITGQGGRNADGFVHLIESAMKEVRPASDLTLVALGGSGQTVGSWASVEERSRREERTMDVPGVKVKETLDQHADVLVVMLGMNDVLSPSLTDKPADIAAWADRYKALLGALRERLHPRTVGLATVTLATEDPQSPKNLLGDQLNQAVADLARDQGCLLLPTRATMEEILNTGRTWRPDFHTTVDYVHPNLAGHVAIAMAMLRGLGEDAAAAKLMSDFRPKLGGAGNEPALSYAVQTEKTPLDTERQSFLVRYWWHGGTTRPADPPKVRLVPPAGWTVADAGVNTFRATGVPDRISNVLQLEADDVSVNVVIPPPWLIAVGIMNPQAWPGNQFNATKGCLPADKLVASGELFPTAPTTNPAAPAVSWQRYFASPDYTGGADPASIDFWSASIGRLFEAGYGIRWIYSPHDRPVQLQLSSRVFAGTIGVTTWLNGEEMYAKAVTAEPAKKVTLAANLKSGWNCLAFKTNKLNWQWQVALEIAGTGSDDLGDLRFSTIPHAKDDRPPMPASGPHVP